MIKEAASTVNQVLTANRDARIFYICFAVTCLIIAIVIAFLCAYVQIWLGVVEFVLAPGLVYSIIGMHKATSNNATILKNAARAFRGVSNQIQLRRRL